MENGKRLLINEYFMLCSITVIYKTFLTLCERIRVLSIRDIYLQGKASIYHNIHYSLKPHL